MSDQLAEAAPYPADRHDDVDEAEIRAGSDRYRDGKPDALFGRRSRASRTGLQIRQGLPFDAWSKMGVQVGALADASAWWIGDWLIYGQQAYPDRYRSAIELTGFSYQTLRNYSWVASRFPLYRRRDTISFGHHAEVASLPEEDREMWLSRAVTYGWSRNELRMRLRNGGRPTAESLPLAIALQIEEQRRELWQAAAIAQGRTLADWITSVADAAAEAILVVDGESAA